MRVLWFSNCRLAGIESSGSGSWLYGMMNVICNQVELYNITESNIKNVQNIKTSYITEYVLPKYTLVNGVPSTDNIRVIQEIVNTIQPDIIHVWGIENYWAELYRKGYIKDPVLLEIQGLLSSCASVFYGGLTPSEIKLTHGFKELIRPFVKLENQYKVYYKKGEMEGKLIGSFKYVSTQSDWTRGQLFSIIDTTSCRIFDTLRPIRNEFYLSKKWSSSHSRNLKIFTSMSYSVPFKGMHILLKAFALIVKKYPNAVLEIAGFNPYVPYYRCDGYIRYLKRIMKKLKIEKNVFFPGKLNAVQLIEHLLESQLFVNPSFVESYSAATAEALYLGVPSVLSYAGAMPNFGDDGKIALFYSPLDYVDCANKIIRLIGSTNFCEDISINAIQTMTSKCNPQMVADRQIAIYNDILGK